MFSLHVCPIFGRNRINPSGWLLQPLMVKCAQKIIDDHQEKAYLYGEGFRFELIDILEVEIAQGGKLIF